LSETQATLLGIVLKPMIFSAIVEAGDSRWPETLQFLSRYDFHHLPDYVALEASRRGGNAYAFIYRDDQAGFFVPFIQSAVPLTLQPRRASQFDALSPYGYAGPLVSAPGSDEQRDDFVAAAIRRMVELLRERGICTLFIRFHPLLLPPLVPFQSSGRLVLHGETVWADLHKSELELWSDTRKTFRNSINHSEHDGCVFEMDSASTHFADFLQLYRDTMCRVKAAPEYFFPEQYFRMMQRALGDGFHLAHVRNPSGSIVSSGMFTVCAGIVQYHLTGNSLEGGSEASKLLLHGVRRWAREQGFGKFHLGGGVGAQKDNLFLFKSGLSSGRAPFYSWRLVVNETICGALCRQWEKLNREHVDDSGGFFPPYRKPAVLYRNITHQNE
jgi:hypothetical protein